LKLTKTSQNKLNNVYPDIEKFVVFPNDRCEESIEIASLVVLKSSNTDKMKFEKISGAEKLKYFANSMYMPELASALIPSVMRFSNSVSISNKLDMVKIEYNQNKDLLEITAKTILDSVEGFTK